MKRRSSHFSCVNTVPVNTYDVMMVTKLDRLARNTRHLLEISEFRNRSPGRC
ncbi:recombinase family protein [Escherichia coli]